MDYQSAHANDMHACDLLKGSNEERGQTATFTHSEKQKWYYLDHQETAEVTVIKIWDSSRQHVSKCESGCHEMSR